MSREKSFAKNTIILAIGTVLPKIAHLITLPIVTDELTKAEYGTYDLIATLVSLFLPIATLQVQTAAFRFLIDCKEDETGKKRVITNVVIFVILSSLLSLTLLFFALYKLDLIVRVLICVYFFTDILLLTFVQVVRGLSNPKLYSLCMSVQPIVNMLLVVVLVYFVDGGLIGALIAMAASTTAALILVLARGKILCNIDCRLLSKSMLKELIDYSWPMIPNSLSLWMLHFSDRLVLLQFVGIEANAIYGAANKIPSMYSLANSAFTLAWQENASVNLKDEDSAAYYGNMFDHILRILAGILAMLIAMTPILFVVLIKGDYDAAYGQMAFLLMSMFFSSISSFLGGIYVAHKRTKNVGATTIIAAAINLVIDLILVQSLEIYAASISTLVAYMFLALYRMKNIQSFQEIKFNYGSMIQYIAVLVVMSILLWLDIWYLDVVNVILGTVFAVVLNRAMIRNIWTMVQKKLSKK
ncbi:MAG: polysaccharide biosynthesis protein [Lachnospiraceae bacterium]|nr:polysaccharide biosynthesis protein [Lachnospiraceae bacterium]